MPSYNQITVIGHLGSDPDMRYTPQGTAVCSFTLAVNNRKKVDGEWKNVAMWFKVKVWGKQAEPVTQFLYKGRPAMVIGRLDVEEWTDNTSGKQRMTFVIDGANVIFLGESGGEGGGARPQDTASSGERPRAATPPPSAPAAPAISDDDIPF